MNRRGFLGALAAAFATPLIGEPESVEPKPERRRVYSFLWDKALIEDPYEVRFRMRLHEAATLAGLRPPDRARDFDALLKELYGGPDLMKSIAVDDPYRRMLRGGA